LGDEVKFQFVFSDDVPANESAAPQRGLDEGSVVLIELDQALRACGGKFVLD
jgi:hypothetical protein